MTLHTTAYTPLAIPLLLLCLLLGSISSRAHAMVPVKPTTSIAATAVDSLDEINKLMPSKLDAELEKLLRTWHKGYSTSATAKGKDDCMHSEMGPSVPDSVYIQRLKRLPTLIPIQFNAQIKRSIELYTKERRRLLRYMLNLADLYFPTVEESLDRHGLPIELKYIAIIESSLNPTAVSPRGAAGMWQFMLATGKIYGLQINSLVDERLDLEKSTDAACRYFKDMYRLYGDWLLSIAAYNCGSGNVNKAIRQAGGKRDFWSIYPYLPRETRNYIPLFIGAYYAMHYHAEHQICAIEMGQPLATDTLLVDKRVSFERIRQLTHVSLDEIRLLNPQYRRELIPDAKNLYTLRLPLTATTKLAGMRDSLYTQNDKVSVVDIDEAEMQSSARRTSSGQTIYHTVRRGQTLSSIANQYGTTVNSIKQSNRLKSNRVNVGQKLRIEKGSKTSARKKSSAKRSSKRKRRK